MLMKMQGLKGMSDERHRLCGKNFKFREGKEMPL